MFKQFKSLQEVGQQAGIDVFDLVDIVIDVVRAAAVEIIEAKSASSAGGKKITKAEWRGIAERAGGQLVESLVDAFGE